VQIHCSWAITRLLVAVVLTSGGWFEARAAHVNIVALGASTTAGHGVGESAAYPAQLEAMLRAKGFDVSVANAGISGDTSSGMLKRLDSAAPSGTQVVLLQLSEGLGRNDARRGLSLAEHVANRGDIVGRLRARGIKVIDVPRRGVPLQGDGVHPTAEGQVLIARRLLPLVVAAIGGSRRR
jgi:acyl-CoA thioesterase I